MSGTFEDFEARLEALIDDWVTHRGSIADVMDALEAKLMALEDEHGADRSPADEFEAEE